MYFLNYAWLDLLLGKYLTCLPPALQGCEELLPHLQSSCARVGTKEGLITSPPAPAQQSALRSLLIPHSVSGIILAANPHGSLATYQVPFQVPYLRGSDSPSWPGRDYFYFYNVTVMIFNEFYSHFTDEEKEAEGG